MTCTIFTITRPPSIWQLYTRRKNSKGLSKSTRYMTWLNANGHTVNRLPKQTGPVDVVIKAARRITQKGKWSRTDGDIDNLAKPVLDLLVACGTIQDDNAEHVHSVSLHWTDDKTIPQGQCRVTLFPVKRKDAMTEIQRLGQEI